MVLWEFQPTQIGCKGIMKISSQNLEIGKFRIQTDSLLFGSVLKGYYTASLLVLKYFPITVSYPCDIKSFKFICQRVYIYAE